MDIIANHNQHIFALTIDNQTREVSASEIIGWAVDIDGVAAPITTIDALDPSTPLYSKTTNTVSQGGRIYPLQNWLALHDVIPLWTFESFFNWQGDRASHMRALPRPWKTRQSARRGWLM